LKDVKQVRVFISSPGDMSRERELVVDICEQISNDLGSIKGFVVDPVRWETHTVSARAERSQLAITDQLGNYDVYLGIMGYYFGSSTGSFASGTEEEFEDALTMNLKDGAPQIQFYFSSARVNLDEVRMDQYTLVKAFREKLKEKGVYFRRFEDLTQFQVLVRKGLTTSILGILDKADLASDRKNLEKTASYKALRPYEVLRNLRNEFSKDPTVSSSLLLFEATKAINSFNSRLNMVAKKTQKVSRAMNEVTREINKLTSGTNRSPTRARRSFEGLMDLMEDFTNWLAYEIPLMEEDFNTGMSDLQRGALIIKMSLELKDGPLQDLFRVAEDTKGELGKLAHSVITGGEAIPEISGFERWETNRKIYRAITLDFDCFLKLAMATITETKNSVLQ